MSRRTRNTRRHPLSSSDEEVIQGEVDQQQSLEVAEERIDVPDGSDVEESYRPSSPGYDQERSATPKSQDKSPSVAASRGGSPDAGSNHPPDADAPREEVSVISNKFTNIPSSTLEAPRENIIVDNPEGQSDMNSPHPKAGGSDDVAVESRRDRIQRLNREMQALIDQEDDDSELLPISGNDPVPLSRDSPARGTTSPPLGNSNDEDGGNHPPPSPQVQNRKSQLIDGAARPSDFTRVATSGGKADEAMQTAGTPNAPALVRTASPPMSDASNQPRTPIVPTPSTRKVGSALPPLPLLPPSKPVQKSGDGKGEGTKRTANGQVVVGNAGAGLQIVGRRAAEHGAQNADNTPPHNSAGANKAPAAVQPVKECKCGICSGCRARRGGKPGTGLHAPSTLKEPKTGPTVANPQQRVIAHLSIPKAWKATGRAGNPHDENVGILLRAAWPYGDVIRCLEASVDEEGEENMDVAQEHLENLRLWRLQNINANCRDDDKGQEEAPDRIKADSEVALYIAVNADHIDAVLHMMDVHDHPRTTHDADHFRTAANLMANPKVAKDAIASRLPPFAVKKIALAVVNDCEKCAALRAQKAAAKKEAEERAERKAKEAAAAEAFRVQQEKQKAEKDAKESKKRKEDEQRRSRTPPLPDNDDDLLREEPFSLADSEWNSKKRGGSCWGCGEGDIGGDKEFILACEVCDHTYHKPCTKFAKVQHTESREIKWACLGCVRTPPANWKLMPTPAPANQRQPPTAPVATPAYVARHLFNAAGGGGDGGGGGGGGGDDDDGPAHTDFPPRTPNNLGNESKRTRISYQVKPYELWQCLPKGHPFHEEHSTKGFSKNAYMNWKRINLQLRDQSRGELGPLTNALTAEMRTSVGNILINYEDVRPRRNMTSKEVSEWIRKDGYNWVSSVTDSVLLKKLDTHFSVLESDPFLSMSFPANIPQMNEDQSVNYMTNAHSAFADEWLHCLGELRAGGWDDSSTDLRQAYIKALAPSPTLYNAASCYKTDSHDLLISYLRSWTQTQSSRQASENHLKQQIKKSLLAKGEATTSVKTATPASPQGKKAEVKEAAALRSEVKQLQTQIKEMKHHASPTASGKFFCNGCGYDYDRDHRKIPCEDACVFEEHEEHNKGYKSGKPWPQGKRKLFWGSPAEYQAKYGKEMPERGKLYLELKRERAKEYELKRQRQTDK